MKNCNTEFDLVEGYFPSIYLTIIALIQGITLSTLAGNFIQEINTGLSSSDPNCYVKYIIVSTTIFLTWHHYMYGIIYLKWLPGVFDTLIPLSLGATQFIIAGIIRDTGNQHYWIISLALLFFIAGCAYLNAAVKTNYSLFAHRYNEELSIKYSRNLKICNFTAACSSILIFIFTVSMIYGMFSDNLMIFIEIMIILHIISYEIFYRKRIQPYYMRMIRREEKRISV